MLIVDLTLQPIWWHASDIGDSVSVVEALSLTAWHMSSFAVLFWWSRRAVEASEVALFSRALVAASVTLVATHGFFVYHVVVDVLSEVGSFGLVWGPAANLAAAAVGFWAYLVHKGHTRP